MLSAQPRKSRSLIHMAYGIINSISKEAELETMKAPVQNDPYVRVTFPYEVGPEGRKRNAEKLAALRLEIIKDIQKKGMVLHPESGPFFKHEYIVLRGDFYIGYRLDPVLQDSEPFFRMEPVVIRKETMEAHWRGQKGKVRGRK